MKGENNDKVNDNVYAAKIVANVPGTYISQVRMGGYIGGVEFYRTTQHIIKVIAEDFELSQVSNSRVVGDELLISLIAKKK